MIELTMEDVKDLLLRIYALERENAALRAAATKPDPERPQSGDARGLIAPGAGVTPE